MNLRPPAPAPKQTWRLRPPPAGRDLRRQRALGGPAWWLGLAWLCVAATLVSPALAQRAKAAAAPSGDELVLEAREAQRKGERARLATLRATALRTEHPLASWVDYWDIGLRLTSVSVEEIEAFYTRWRGTYVEDRLRNDFLLELGRRRDWAAFARDYPRFRMNDDREVSCYALLVQHQSGQDVTEAARAAWYAQREADDGCQLLARTLFEARRLQPDDVWRRAQLAVEANRPRVARAAVALLGAAEERAVAEALDNPLRVLRQPHGVGSVTARQRLLLAVIRAAAQEPETVATLLAERVATDLPPDLRAHAWAAVGRQAALRLLPEAASYYARAVEAHTKAGRALTPLSDETLAWQVRAALRAPRDPARWSLVEDAVAAMSAEQQQDAAWVYWRARARLALAPAGAAGEEARAAARTALQAIADPLTFYGQLATEDLGGRPAMPAAAAAPGAAELAAAQAHPGLQRALRMIAIGLRPEGVREWNFSLRGMGERELLAAAQLACEREVWDRCINTSDRTRTQVLLAQRYPTPFREEVLAASRAIGLDAALVYGLIRQESRFILDARSHVGASGLMQLMPATARWTARKVGLEWKPELITDREVNLRLGTTYLKLVLDDFGGSLAMAAAAYNAGPSRPRRWREGAVLEPAAWAESIPFNETRDYVKKVLANATVYSAVLRPEAVPTLRSRLGGPIGPREAASPAPDKDLP
jgi:soluble lytic murein transglycosylase